MHRLRQIIISLTVSTLLFLSVYSFFQFSEYKKYTNYVEHTYRVLNTIERLKGHIYALIASRRGYLASPSPEFKNQITEQRKAVLAVSDSLAILTADNRFQKQNILQIHKLLPQSVLFSDGWVAEAPNYREISDISNELNKYKLMNDSIFNELEEIKKIEVQLLGIRSGFQNDSGNSVPLMLLFSGLVAISMIIYAFYNLNIELQERIRTKNALEKNNQYLNEANTELERFAFITSHNLKEPLRKARTVMSRMREEPVFSGTSGEQISKVEEHLSRLQLMLDDLLAYSMLLNNTNNKEAIALNVVIADVIKQFNPQIVATDAIIQVDKIPVIEGYSSQLRILFVHLLSNSLKYIRQGVPPVIQITYSLDPQNKEHLICVSDNGIGFEEVYAPKIFELFGRLHSKDEFEGNGVGLAVCRRIMANHGGHIRAQSLPSGGGAVFTMHFPK